MRVPPPAEPRSGSGARQLTLRLGADGERRPVGTIQPPGEEPVGFVGWVALMSVLGRLMPAYHAGSWTTSVPGGDDPSDDDHDEEAR